MNIVLPKYITNYNLCPLKNNSEARQYDLTFEHQNTPDYLIYWGLPTNKLNISKKFGVMETGFFNEAAFIDTIGSYQQSSLNTKYCYDQVYNFDLNGRKSAKEIIYNLPAKKQSKFNPTHGNKIEFDQEIILACQNPTDRSITFPHTPSEYWNFIEGACKYYGKDLFLKLHPWNSNEKIIPFQELASKYNCGIGKFPLSLLKDKHFVITFNSTIAIDCILLGVPYVQYAIGTFWNCFGVTFSNYSFPHHVPHIENAENLADFLIYKYCFLKVMKKDKYAEMIKHFASSSEIFPMNDDFCYATNVQE